MPITLGPGTYDQCMWRHALNEIIGGGHIVHYTRIKGRDQGPKRVTYSNAEMPVQILENKRKFCDMAHGYSFLPATHICIEDLRDIERVIIKPNLGSDGQGIRVVNATEVYTSDFNHNCVQSLLSDVLLFEGRKFHVRVIYLWIPGRGAFLMWNGIIRASLATYNADDLSLDVQISNLLTSSSPEFKSHPLYRHCLPALRRMGQELFDCLESRVNTRPKPKHEGYMYDLYGLDVIFTTAYECKLLEVNVYWSMNPCVLNMVRGAFALLVGHSSAADQDAFV